MCEQVAWGPGGDMGHYCPITLGQELYRGAEKPPYLGAPQSQPEVLVAVLLAASTLGDSEPCEGPSVRGPEGLPFIASPWNFPPSSCVRWGRAYSWQRSHLVNPGSAA